MNILNITKKFLFISAFVAVIFCSTTSAYAQTQISNTGFTQGNIWFSQDKLVEGDKVKIFTAIWNGGQDILSGNVIFYDKSVVLGQKDFTLQPNELKQSSIDWQVTAGDHSISAQIIDAKILVGKKDETILTSYSKTKVSEQFIPKNPALIKKDPIVDNAANTDTVLIQAEKAGEFIKQNIPASVSEPVSKAASSVDSWRENTALSINTKKDEVKAEIKKINEVEKINTENKNNEKKSVVEKPLAYVKSFFLTLGSFIFNNKIVFYGLSILILFAFIRFIYRKIKHG